MFNIALRCRQNYLFLFYLIIAWVCCLMTVLLHEWTHGGVAWVFGFKASPFAIDYGGTGWRNLIYFANINEAVQYVDIGKAGHPFIAALISIIPPLLINGGFTLTLAIVLSYHHFKRPLLMWITFWLFIWNLGECFSYFVQRCFSGHGDISGFLYFTHTSPWIIFVPAIYLVFFFIHLCFTHLLPKLLIRMNIQKPIIKMTMFVLILIILFGFYTIRGLNTDNNQVTIVLSSLSLIIMPIFYLMYSKHYV